MLYTCGYDPLRPLPEAPELASSQRTAPQSRSSHNLIQGASHISLFHMMHLIVTNPKTSLSEGLCAPAALQRAPVEEIERIS